ARGRGPRVRRQSDPCAGARAGRYRTLHDGAGARAERRPHRHAGQLHDHSPGPHHFAAARLRIPTVYPYRFFVEAGGLLSYGVDVVDLFRRAPEYVSRILRGVNPGELPVQAPTKFELAINLKAAKALGLALPKILLAGADDLIE